MESTEEGSVVTCMACRVRLVGVESRRGHYRTDMHRVNLQRKVAGLQPLTADDYARRMEAIQNEAKEQAGRRRPTFCEVCSKKFSSEKALENHVLSRRHRDAIRATPELAASNGPAGATSPVDSDEDEVGPDGLTFDEEMAIEQRISEAEPFASNECVFDGHVNVSPEDNITYMAKKFGFFVPYVEHLADSKGLLEYIGQKVGIGYACIECSKAFISVRAAQRHMVDKSHARMTSDEDVWIEEYAQFYEFGSDGEDGDQSTKDWEEVEGDEAEEALADLDKQVAVADPENERREKPPSKYEETQEEEVAMVIGSKVIGHRSLRRYYQQSGRLGDVRDAVVINKVLNEYRMLGWKDQKMPAAKMHAARMAAMKFHKQNLEVGMKNYYTRKAPLRIPMAVFNSGYRP